MLYCRYIIFTHKRYIGRCAFFSPKASQSHVLGSIIAGENYWASLDVDGNMLRWQFSWDRTLCEFRHISSSSVPAKSHWSLVEQLQWCTSIIYIFYLLNVLEPFICGPASNFWGPQQRVLIASFHPMIYARTLYYVELRIISGIYVFYAGIVADNTFLLVVACAHDL